MIRWSFALAIAAVMAQAAPEVRQNTDAISFDVRVVDRNGSPVTGLTPADFEVKVDGRARPVTSATYETSIGAVLIAVDQDNLRVGSSRAVLDAAAAFVERLPSSDSVGFTLLPRGTPSIDVGADRAAVAGLLRRLVGIYNEMSPPGVDEKAVRLALHGLIGRMSPLPGRRTIVFLTDRLDQSVSTADLSHRAALSGVAFYVIASDALPMMGEAGDVTVSGRDEYSGLIGLAATSGGALFRRISGAGPLFDRLARELSGQYILRIAADPSGESGTHDLRIRVKRSGVDVRVRREFVR